MTSDGRRVPLRERNFYLFETGVGVVATLATYLLAGAVVGGGARVVLAVVVGLVVSNGLQWYRS